MTKAEKFVTFNYYLHDLKCVCGKPKEKIHWVCESCKDKNWKTETALHLNDACKNHVVAARAFLDLCQQTAEPTQAAA